MNIDGFQRLLDSFCEQHELPKASIEADGYCGMLGNEQIKVFLRFDLASERVQLFAKLGDVPQESLSAVAISLAYANCHWNGTEGATLAIEEDSSLAYLQHQFDTDGLDVEQLTRLLGYFFDHADQWRNQLATHVEQATAGPRTAASSILPDPGAVQV